MVGSVPTPPLRRQAVIRVDLTSRLPNPYAYRQDRNGTTGGHREAGCIQAGLIQSGTSYVGPRYCGRAGRSSATFSIMA
ncbi:hypothetical protein NSND_62642 [Nitrospira sp. ND1]|nr:hypothetical protein NSND_62642 [Nitrospira sp. ND1]